MPRADRAVCSNVSASSSEPLIGTASRYRLWMMVEQPGPWGHQALIESNLPAEVGSHLRVAGRDLGIRVLLVKRRDRRQRRRRCFFAYTGTRDRRLRFLDLDDPRELLDLDLAELATRHFAGVGEEVIGPLFLVCTHGKHDPCCAREGGPLFRSIEHFRDRAVWECTHVGGDRFAGNLVCFPHGLYFGRVTPKEAPRIVEAYTRGEIPLEHYRGRSAYSPGVQAAEERIRRTYGLTGVDDLTLVRHVGREQPSQRIEFSGPNWERYAAEVEVGSLDPRPLTCKALHPHSPRGFSVSDVED
ncbi:MAG TPA: sucrase ferredoxin [Actinomycetota bacterium]|nr:sucrase ferredoxin [Actinomycetota bacterium]